MRRRRGCGGGRPRSQPRPSLHPPIFEWSLTGSGGSENRLMVVADDDAEGTAVTKQDHYPFKRTGWPKHRRWGWSTHFACGWRDVDSIVMAVPPWCPRHSSGSTRYTGQGNSWRLLIYYVIRGCAYGNLANHIVNPVAEMIV